TGDALAGAIHWVRRVESGGLRLVGQRLFPLAEPAVGDAPRVPAVRVIRLEVNRPGEIGDGFFPPPGTGMTLGLVAPVGPVGEVFRARGSRRLLRPGRAVPDLDLVVTGDEPRAVPAESDAERIDAARLKRDRLALVDRVPKNHGAISQG